MKQYSAILLAMLLITTTVMARDIGIQLGHISGVLLSSKESGSENLTIAMGVNERDMALQIQKNKTFPLQTIRNWSWYYGISAEIITKSSTEIGVGIPFGLIYTFTEGPRFFAELTPIISVGSKFMVSLNPEIKVTLPL